MLIVLVQMSADVARSYGGDGREVIRDVPLYYPSWLKVPKERKAALITDIGTQFDLRPHMESPNWTEINAASSSTCKRRTIPTMLLSRPSIGL
nr:hypothetical protein [Tanacetum cinerariifolium]